MVNVNTFKPLHQRSLWIEKCRTLNENNFWSLYLEPLCHRNLQILNLYVYVWNFYLKSLNLDMETLSGTFEPLCGISRPSVKPLWFMWNLFLEPFNLYVKTLLYLELHMEPTSETFEPLFGTVQCGPVKWNLYLKPLCGCGIFICNFYLELLCKTLYETFMWYLAKPEPLCGTWTFWVWNLYVETLWNLSFLGLEPLCGTLTNLVPGFRPLPQTTPKLDWQDPKIFKLLGNKNIYLKSLRHNQQISCCSYSTKRHSNRGRRTCIMVL